MRKSVAGAIAFLLLWTGGCASQTTTPSQTTTSEGQSSQAPAGKTAARNISALVRFVNADSRGKVIEIWSDDNRVFNDVEYKGITPYMELPTGVRHFRLRETGGTKDLATYIQELFPGRHRTIVALPGEKGTTRLAVLNDTLAELDPGKARVRLVNATPDVDNLDLYVSGTKTKLQSGVDASVATSFTDAKPGMLEIRPAKEPAVSPLSMLKVEADRLYTFIVVGTRGAPDIVTVEDRTEQ